MLSILHSATLVGIEACSIRIEVDVSRGLPGFSMVGLPDSVVKESRDRVFAAIRNSGYEIPSRKIVVSLAPADLRKTGSAFDLPIALGILMASEQIRNDDPPPTYVIGELSLEAAVKPVRGLLSLACYVSQLRNHALLFPEDNAEELCAFSSLSLKPVANLNEAIEQLHTPEGKGICGSHPRGSSAKPPKSGPTKDKARNAPDLSDVRGQLQARRALEIAAAGAHHFLLVGSPGCGKSLLTQRLPSILPPMTEEESLTTTMIHSAAGLLSAGQGLMEQRPFRAPHHIISHTALVGGGSYPRPGEISLAHNGVLFLDELAEFSSRVLETLRQPLEEGRVTIARSGATVTYPSRIILGAAMNPCPCGYHGHPSRACNCRHHEVKRYLSKMSGPLLDRIDIQLEMPSLSHGEIVAGKDGEASKPIRDRVMAARKMQSRRFKPESYVHCNAHMNAREVKQHCPLSVAGEKLMGEAMSKLNLSARAYHRTLKLARTIADLSGSEKISEEHLMEAIHYRSLDRLMV